MSAEQAYGLYETMKYCNDKNKGRLLELLDLIKHREARPADCSCDRCVKFLALATSIDAWPWRDYETDEPLAGDL